MFARPLVLIGLALVIAACGETSPEAEHRNGVGAEQAAPTATNELDVELREGECIVTGVSIAMIPDIASLAWASDQIVVGEVVRAHPTTPDPRESRLPLHTDVDIRVESFVRGQALETVTVRQPGGEIPGGCADPMGQLELAPGDRFLLFLDRDERAEFPPAFLVVGERQGYWRLTDDNTFADLAGHYRATFERRPLAGATAAIRDALLGPMPAGPVAGVAPVVPLDAAPLNLALEE